MRWQRWMLVEKCSVALERHGFRTVPFARGEEALPFLLEEARSAATIGFGGSMTTIIKRKPRGTEIGICLINENLGY